MTATAVPLWNVAAFGWVCVGRVRHADTTVDTWTGGHDVLVLVWSGEANVVAAVLNGEPVDIETLPGDWGAADDTMTVLDRAAHHVNETHPDRMGTELGNLFDSARRTLDARGMDALPLRMRAALHNLALAILSTPTK